MNNGTVGEQNVTHKSASGGAKHRLDEVQLTPIQRRIVDLLKDGKPHYREDVLACLENEDATHRNLSPHLAYLRRRIRPAGYDVIVQVIGYVRYFRMINA